MWTNNNALKEQNHFTINTDYNNYYINKGNLFQTNDYIQGWYDLTKYDYQTVKKPNVSDDINKKPTITLKVNGIPQESIHHEFKSIAIMTNHKDRNLDNKQAIYLKTLDFMQAVVNYHNGLRTFGKIVEEEDQMYYIHFGVSENTFGCSTENNLAEKKFVWTDIIVHIMKKLQEYDHQFTQRVEFSFLPIFVEQKSSIQGKWTHGLSIRIQVLTEQAQQISFYLCEQQYNQEEQEESIQEQKKKEEKICQRTLLIRCQFDPERSCVQNKRLYPVTEKIINTFSNIQSYDTISNPLELFIPKIKQQIIYILHQSMVLNNGTIMDGCTQCGGKKIKKNNIQGFSNKNFQSTTQIMKSQEQAFKKDQENNSWAINSKLTQQQKEQLIFTDDDLQKFLQISEYFGLNNLSINDFVLNVDTGRNKLDNQLLEPQHSIPSQYKYIQDFVMYNSEATKKQEKKGTKQLSYAWD